MRFPYFSWRPRQAFLTDRRAGVSLIVAIAIPVLIGFAALVAEYGHAMLIKSDSQRIADLAAYAGALAYNSNSTTTSMTSAAQAVAALNGISSANVSAALVSSPSGDGAQAVQVTISTRLQLYLAEILGAGTSIPIASAAYAELKANGAACIIALSSGGSGVTLSGGTSVTANSCTVASNATVTVPCGTTVTTKVVDYNSSAAPSQPCSGIQPPSGSSATSIVKKSTSDPLASNTGVTTATGHISAVAALSSPSAPTASTGCNLSFDWNNSASACLIAQKCTDAYSNGVYSVGCPSGGTYTFGSLSMGGGVTVNFTATGSATYSFSGLVSTSGTISFGAGVYTLAGGLTTGGGSTTTFGAGTFKIGPISSGCNGATYSICNTGTTLTFGGPSTFVISEGLYNSGGSTLTMGSGSSNSYQIGASSNGNAMYMGGGAKTALADATSGVFQLVGSLDIAGGGSCTTLPATAQHDINGSFITAGGVILGTGVYTVNGYVALGGNGGGDVTCNGSDVGMTGTGVTFAISGVSVPNSGACSGYVFCLAAGYSNVTLTAPSSGTTEGLVVVGPTSSSVTAGALFSEGSSGTSLSGAFYFPNGQIALTGGSSIGNGSSQCLELIGAQISLSGGTTAASTCVTSGSSSGSASVVLVQ